MANYEGSEDGELPETSPSGRDRVHASPVPTRQDRGGSAHGLGGGPVERPVAATIFRQDKGPTGSCNIDKSDYRLQFSQL